MKSANYLLAASAGTLLITLAGCNGSSGTYTGGGAPVGVSDLKTGSYVAAGASDTAAKGLSAGKTLDASAATASSVDLAYKANTAALHSGSTFSVKKNASGGLDMIVNGETISFADADQQDATGYGKDVGGANDQELNIGNGGTLAGQLAGTDSGYMQVWHFQNDKDGTTSTRGFAVTGAETSPDTVKTAANATYNGHAQVRTFVAGSQNERTRMDADMALNADFANGTVSGTLTNLQGATQDSHVDLTWSTPTALPGAEVDMTEAKITGNGFSGGTLKGNDALDTAIDGNLDGSTYSGRFYGPGAEQVGGIMNVKGTSEGDKFVGYGVFGGSK